VIDLGIDLALGLAAAGTINLNADGTLNNNATLTIVAGYTQINDGTLNNNGTLNNKGKLNNSGTFYTYLGKSVKGSGTYRQTAGATIINGTMTQASVYINGGSLSGAGTIQASKITIGEKATVKPGNSPGTLIMISDVDLLGNLETEIFSNSLFDVFEVHGHVTLSDTSAFHFLFDDLFTAIAGDSFDFLSAFTFGFGSFDNFDDWFDPTNFRVTNLAEGFVWSVSYNDSFDAQTSNYLSLNILADGFDGNPNSVSGPDTLGLLGLSLALIGWGSRRAKLSARTA
jgi:hypothetical protein